MQRIRKISVIEQSELAIRALAEGLAPGATLPSIRNLAKLLGVSTPTIQAALVRLEKRHVLARSATNRPYARAAGAAVGATRPETAAKGRKLLVISSEPWDAMTISERTILGQLTMELAQEGFSVAHEQVNFEDAVRPRKSWDRMLETQHPTHLLLMGANQALVDWCKSSRLPFLANGANVGVSGAATLQRDIRGGVEDAVRRLRELGHRRILLPAFNRNHKLVPEMEKALAAGLRIHADEVRSLGLVPFARSENIGDLHRALSDWLDRARPTAVITLNWRNYLLVASMLAQRGQRVPRDVSVICMSDDPDGRWCHPTPAHYSTRHNDYVRIIRRWALRGTDNAGAALKTVGLLWNAGGSVGSAPAA